ncbi:MAG: ribonuclease activity regulator RraA [Deltaproteobacteria bacterium]|nr:ribonuclease activity regulator RraA [Deltaproteobacteria bacterium]
MVSKETIEKLRSVTTATLISLLMKKGIKNAVMLGVRPLAPSTPKCVGPAFTMRNIPMREDLAGPEVLADPNYPQRVMLETAPPGSVVVLDCRGEGDNGMVGDLMIARLKVRGVEAFVGDGGVRDAVETAAMQFPVYCKGISPYPSTNRFLAVELQCPIGCGGVAVYPGDIIAGDGDGVVVIPQKMADEIATKGQEAELIETFVKEKLEEGRPMPGTYPPDEKTMKEFEAWKRNR